MRVQRFVDISEAREHYLQLADDAAQAAFEKSGYLATVHGIKHREALAGAGPLLEQEAAASGITLKALAASVLDRRAEMEAALAAVEHSRIIARRRMREAADVAGLYAALSEHKRTLSQL